MAAGDAGAWARLRLVQGDSGTAHWEFAGGAAETRLTVGSNPSCQWVVEDPSVEPFHLVFRWDGNVLAVAGSRESVALTLDGQPVGTTFVKVGARARLEFGRCALVAETSAPHAHRRKATLSSAPPPAGRSGPPAGRPGAHSSAPPKQTLMGVAALTDATPPSREPGGSEAPGRRAAKPSGPGATAIGMPPAPHQGSPGATGSPPRAPADSAGSADSDRPGPAMPRLGSDRPMNSTLYGLGSPVEGLNVDVVSPSRLRRSSIPPGRQPEDAEDPGRVTATGFPDGAASGAGGPSAQSAAIPRRPRPDPTPTDTRLIEDAQRLRALGSAQVRAQEPSPSYDSDGPPADRGRGADDSARPASASSSQRPMTGASAADSEDNPGQVGQARRPHPGPAHFRPSGPMPARRPSTWAVVVGLGALAAFGVWVYALLRL